MNEAHQLICKGCGRLKDPRFLRDALCFQCGASPALKAKVKHLAAVIVEKGQSPETARALKACLDEMKVTQ